MYNHSAVSVARISQSSWANENGSGWFLAPALRLYIYLDCLPTKFPLLNRGQSINSLPGVTRMLTPFPKLMTDGNISSKTDGNISSK